MLSVVTTEKQKQNKAKKPKGTRKLREVLDRSLPLTVGTASWVSTDVQTPQIVHMYNSLYISHASRKLLKKKKKKSDKVALPFLGF